MGDISDDTLLCGKLAWKSCPDLAPAGITMADLRPSGVSTKSWSPPGRYTSEFRDVASNGMGAHNRAVILRGSSRYAQAAVQAESYYFQPALELDRHGRYLLMDDSYERAATVGFRCASDA